MKRKKVFVKIIFVSFYCNKRNQSTAKHYEYNSVNVCIINIL